MALTGISVALVALVLTWNGWTTRQWASAIAALLPIATALVVVFPPTGAASIDSALAISLFISAILYQTAGSFLHLISSGTRSHERELITSGQTRMFRLADEVRGKEEALHFREAALIKREADAENDEMSIQRQKDSLQEARTQLESLEEDYRKRSDAVVQKEREWAGKIADVESRERVIADKSQAVELREQEVARSTPLVSAREQRLVEREGELTKREVELTQRQQDLDNRTTAIPESEARLEARRKELDQKTNELLRREGAVSAAESGGKPGTPVPAGTQDVAARELKLQQLKLVLDEQNVTLGRRAKETTERAKGIEAALKASAVKEAALATREASLRQSESDLADRVKAADERRGVYETASRDYESRLGEIGKTQVETAQKAAQLDQTLKTLADREAAVQEREKRARGAQTSVEAREKAVNARERALSANEAELSLRRQEVTRGSDLGIAGLAAVAAADQIDADASPSRKMRGRGAGVRDLSETEPVAPAAETLRAPTQRRIADRLPTGTPRLDDLLLGGLPPKSHLVLVGDAFVGKEIVLYAFIAEGLKRGEPAVIVTATRTPNEVAQSLGVVLPQFREYEQMGMVTWIDASAPGTGAASGTPHRFVTKGSDDRAGILSNLVKASKAADGDKQVPFRVGFLGLAGVLAHGDERASFSFLQNVVGILKPRNALAVYSLEGAALSDAPSRDPVEPHGRRDRLPPGSRQDLPFRQGSRGGPDAGLGRVPRDQPRADRRVVRARTNPLNRGFAGPARLRVGLTGVFGPVDHVSRFPILEESLQVRDRKLQDSVLSAGRDPGAVRCPVEVGQRGERETARKRPFGIVLAPPDVEPRAEGRVGHEVAIQGLFVDRAGAPDVDEDRVRRHCR